MKLIYLEAGSGALHTVPNEMISLVSSVVEIPVIVGGGIRDAKTAVEKIKAGANIIVTGNLLQSKDGLVAMKEIAAAVKKNGRR